MHDQPEKDFEQLQKLLALKRHESPPPGYFNEFSGRVIARIEADAAAQSESWLAGLFAVLKARPAISTSFCLAAGLVLVAATTLFEADPGTTRATLPTVEPQLATTSNQARSATVPGLMFVTNLQPRFAVEMTPPPAYHPPTNSLFGTPSLFAAPYWQDTDTFAEPGLQRVDSLLRIEPVPANH